MSEAMLVDTQKLETVREAVDLWIVEAALEGGLSRMGAAAAMADRAGFALRVLRRPAEARARSGDRETWVVYAVSRDVWRRALDLAVQGATISATGTELLEREPWHYESADRDEAVLAALCRLLNENADVGAGDGPSAPVAGSHGTRYAAMGAWFEPVKQQWAKLAAMRAEKAKQKT